MTCRTELVNSTSYQYCPDDLPPRADRLQAVMQGRFVDELTGNGLTAKMTITTEVDHLVPRSAFNGIAGLVANPARRFPGLAVNSVDVEMRVACRRYITQSFNSSLGPFNTGVGYPDDFPDIFDAINLGDVGLHRQATRIKGRCVQNNGINRTPLSNATVALSGLWHQFPAADVDPLAVVQSTEIISLLQGLYARRQTGVDQVRQRGLQPIVGEEKNLLFPANIGATELRLSDRVNLAAGQVLAIDIGHSDLVEYIQVDSVVGASSETQVATITLAYPLLKSHREGVSAVRVNLQPPGTANNLIRDAIPGDQTIFLDALTDLNNSTVEISGSGVPEYHQMQLYSVLSDIEGYFVLPPISRVAMMQLHSSHAVPVADIDLVMSPDYEKYENSINLIFS